MPQPGEFLLTQSTSGEVVLQARQESHPNSSRVSISTAAALNVAGDKLEFYVKPERVFYVNDVLTDLPTSELQLPQGGRIVPGGTVDRLDLTIYWPDDNTGVRVILYADSHIDLGIARLNGDLTYEGILGNLDGNMQDDMQIRDGEPVTLPASAEQFKRFGDSWRLSVADSLFNDPAPASEDAGSEVPLTILDLDPAVRTDAKGACQEEGLVYVDDIMTSAAAEEQGLTATNEPCETPAEVVAEAAATDEPVAEAAATDEPVAETAATDEPVAEPEIPAEDVAETVTEAEPVESDAANSGGGGPCSAPLAMPMFLGIALFTVNKRKKRQ